MKLALGRGRHNVATYSRVPLSFRHHWGHAHVRERVFFHRRLLLNFTTCGNRLFLRRGVPLVPLSIWSVLTRLQITLPVDLLVCILLALSEAAP